MPKPYSVRIATSPLLVSVSLTTTARTAAPPCQAGNSYAGRICIAVSEISVTMTTYPKTNNQLSPGGTNSLRPSTKT